MAGNPEIFTDRIPQTPEIMAGKPVIKGTRIPVERVLANLAQNPDLSDLFAVYPELTEEDVKACLAYGHTILEYEEANIQSLDSVAVEIGRMNDEIGAIKDRIDALQIHRQQVMAEMESLYVHANALSKKREDLKTLESHRSKGAIDRPQFLQERSRLSSEIAELERADQRERDDTEKKRQYKVIQGKIVVANEELSNLALRQKEVSNELINMHLLQRRLHAASRNIRKAADATNSEKRSVVGTRKAKKGRLSKVIPYSSDKKIKEQMIHHLRDNQP